MNDKDKLLEMFRSAGIVWQETAYTNSIDIDVYAGDSPCNKGYNGFFTGFEFDKDGKLETIGAWE